ncbi:MAG: hypothetical protein R8G66_32785 [Cytophagales bacterium]|nr:hypothetical protein [Cytophagales bacterium]
MLTRQLCFTVILLMTVKLQAQELSFRTVALSNLRFLEASDWGNLPVDANGEDANSKQYGLTYPAREEGSDVLIEPPTLAREQLFINAEIENPFDEYWEIDMIELEIQGEYELSRYKFREGAWSSSRIKTAAYIPYFIIADELVDHPKNLVMGPSAGYSDNRFWIKVDFSGTDKGGMISRFLLRCTLVSKTDGRKITIQSDKAYLLASG